MFISSHGLFSHEREEFEIAQQPRLWNELPVNIFIRHFNSNCFEMTDIALEFHFSVIHVLISVYV